MLRIALGDLVLAGLFFLGCWGFWQWAIRKETTNEKEDKK